MKRFTSTLLAALLVSFGALGASAENYNVDAVHSSVVFRIKHANVAYFYGMVAPGPTGTIQYNAASPEATVFDVKIAVANLQTGNTNRDNHIKAPTFFNAKDFPEIAFKSTSVKKGEGNVLEVTGDLTIKGVKKSVTMKMEMTGTGKSQRGADLVGFEAMVSIKRSDFGITEMLGMLGDDVRIVVSLEAAKS